jgi:hypothetical protein
MADIPSKVKALIDSVRNKLTVSPKTPSGRMLDQRGRGYQLYVKEQEMNGEPAVSHEEWMKTQDPELGSPL